ncbi:TetR/AcrR family transcriptional regulator [Demequina aurantiaca]|uniref:TetR/AcrR family transcriptional regulator n=1 Tax=Demequina aurantiaca TaxID=676200 RepID=UPI000783F507|nr:TetR/AcrR family transcriptional regulator [Demequina aurantiaca]
MVKRKDAVANRERLILAGFEILAVRDADLTVRELAIQTGLGIGTAYRHFPTHEDLIRALYDRGVMMLGESLRASGEDATAWDTIATLLESAVFALADAPGLRTVMRRMYDIDPDYRPAGSFTDSLTGLIERAQAEGTLREGVTGGDLALMMFSLGGMVGNPTDHEANLMRRQLVIFLDGIRADGKGTELPGTAMDAVEFHAFVHRSNAPHA